MNSWQIIKEQFTKDSRPGTVGKIRDLNLAADLFIKMRYHIKDYKEAEESLNADAELRDALIKRRGIEEFKKAGIL